MDTLKHQQTPRLLRLADVQERVGMGRSWILAAVKAGTFPRPIKHGRASLYVEAEVSTWIRARIADRDGEHPQPRLLATEKELADALGVSVSFLQKDRLGKKRIPFTKLDNAVRYDVERARVALALLQQGGAR